MVLPRASCQTHQTAITAFKWHQPSNPCMGLPIADFRVFLTQRVACGRAFALTFKATRVLLNMLSCATIGRFLRVTRFLDRQATAGAMPVVRCPVALRSAIQASPGATDARSKVSAALLRGGKREGERWRCRRRPVTSCGRCCAGSRSG